MDVSADGLAQEIRSAEWSDLTKRLLLVARDVLAKYAPPDRRRYEKTCQVYVERAVEELLGNGPARVSRHRWNTLFQLLGTILLDLVGQDDQEVTRIVREADWDDVTQRVLAYTVSKHGRDARRSGKEPMERLNEAVKILLERRHHYPYYRGVSLVAFLCKTIDGIVSHDAEKRKGQGPHFRIVRKRTEGSSGEYGEDELPAVGQNPQDVIAEKQNERFIASLEPELQPYVRLRVREPYWTAKEYAAELGTTEKQIRNWDRKLRRRQRKPALGS